MVLVREGRGERLSGRGFGWHYNVPNNDSTDGKERMDARLLDYLQRILTARVRCGYRNAPRTGADSFRPGTGNSVWLNGEKTLSQSSVSSFAGPTKQDGPSPRWPVWPVGSSVPRQGTTPRVSRCRPPTPQLPGVVIVMPVTTPRLKSDAVRELGGEVVLHGG